MKSADVTTAVLLMAIGFLHSAVVFFNAPAVAIATTVWQVSGGLFVILVGVLNLLRVYYGEIAQGVRVVSAGANVVLLALAVALAVGWGIAYQVRSAFVVVVVVISTVLSLRPMPKRASGVAQS